MRILETGCAGDPGYFCNIKAVGTLSNQGLGAAGA
jgi:hypothetical protein